MKLFLLLLGSFLASAQAVSFYEVVSDEWVTWKLFHGKNYSNEVEDKFRLKIFMENKANVARHNAAAHRGEKPYFLTMNFYVDFLHHEFLGAMNGYNYALKKRQQ
jgi:cathepsin L